MKKNNLSRQDKIALIGKFKNMDFIDECVKNYAIGVSEIDRVDILIATCDRDLVETYIEERENNLRNEEIISLISATKDIDYIKEIVTKMDLGLSETQEAMILEKNDVEEIRLLLRNTFENSDGTTIYKVSQEDIQVENISQITNELLKSSKIGNIIIGIDVYTRREYLQIKREIDELLEGIKIPKKDNKMEELNAFKEIYTRLAKKISYNHYAISESGKKDAILRRTCRNMYDGLVKN